MNPAKSARAVMPGKSQAAADPNGVPLLGPACAPNLDHLVTQDDTPLDNFVVERQQRLLTEPLYSSWPGPGKGPHVRRRGQCRPVR